MRNHLIRAKFAFRIPVHCFIIIHYCIRRRSFDQNVEILAARDKVQMKKWSKLKLFFSRCTVNCRFRMAFIREFGLSANIMNAVLRVHSAQRKTKKKNETKIERKYWRSVGLLVYSTAHVIPIESNWIENDMTQTDSKSVLGMKFGSIQYRHRNRLTRNWWNASRPTTMPPSIVMTVECFDWWMWHSRIWTFAIISFEKPSSTTNWLHNIVLIFPFVFQWAMIFPTVALCHR